VSYCSICGKPRAVAASGTFVPLWSRRRLRTPPQAALRPRSPLTLPCPRPYFQSYDEPWKVEDRGEKPAIAMKGR
jgi:hypothetical protein